jgi:hypothetical protein
MPVLHRIRRQRWLGRTADSASALTLRAYLRERGETALTPALEGAFDLLDDGSERHLGRLEIRVSVSSPDRLDEELPQGLALAARAALAQALASVQTASRESKPVPPSLRARLLRYLASGELDWWIAQLSDEELGHQMRIEAALVHDELLAAPPSDDGWPALLALLPAAEAVWPDVLFRLLQLLDADAEQALLACAAGSVALPESAAIIARLAGRAASPASADTRRRLAALRLAMAAARQVQQWQRMLDSLRLHAAWYPVAELLSAPAGEVLSVADRRPLSVLPRAGEAVSPVASIGQARSHDASEPAVGIPLRAAGLILLHPWLARLFTEVGWMPVAPPAGEAFPQQHLAPALALLNWLASGREEAPEYALGGAKLLLGLLPDSHFPVGAGLLDPAAREEGDALLQALIQHWPALGQTSIDGLRLTFLQRGGLLYPHGEGWLLRMQVESYDVLLDRLPWGIGLIRLPWCPWTLHVDWGRP